MIFLALKEAALLRTPLLFAFFYLLFNTIRKNRIIPINPRPRKK